MRPAELYKSHDLMTYILQSADFRLWPIFIQGFIDFVLYLEDYLMDEYYT